MTALNRTVAFGTGEDDGFPEEGYNDNGPATPPDEGDDEGEGE